MGNLIKKNAKIGIKEEVTENTFVGVASVDDFIRPSEMALEQSKEVLERDLLGQGLTAAATQAGMDSVAGSCKLEMKAHGTAGTAPEYGLLIESLLGNTRSAASNITDDTEGGSYSTTVLCMAAADIADYAVGDIIMVKVSGDYHISPITTIGTNEITLLVAASNAFVDGLTVEAFNTYLSADSGHKSFSVSRYLEDAILEQAAGCKTKSMSLEGFEAGGRASLNFSFDGLSTDRSVSANSYTSPSYDSALPPIILSACLYQDGTALPVNEVGLSIENTLAVIASTCAANGKTGQRVVKRSIKGNINPYKSDDGIAQWTLFKNDTEFSIFFTAKVPTVSGEYGDVISFYMPVCKINTIGESDKDELLQDGIEFSCSGSGNNDLFITFI